MVASFSNDDELFKHDFYYSKYIGFEEKYGSFLTRLIYIHLTNLKV